MCLAIPGRIVELITDPAHLAMVEVTGVRRRVDLGLLAGRHARGRRLGADPRRLRDEQDQRATRPTIRCACSPCSARTQAAMEEVRGYGLEGREP